jgi:voltage-gated potassium channel
VRALTRVAAEHAGAARVEAAWEPAILAALLATTPAYYESLLATSRSGWASFLYALASLVLAAGLAHTARRTHDAAAHWRANALDVLLAAGLLMAALLPSSAQSAPAWWWRSGVAALTLARLVWTLLPRLHQRDLLRLLAVALGVFGACGAGFWWLEPRAHSFGDGLWLAFTTAATVGYGDIVPTTAASKIFSVFVVLLGYAVISLLTAAIAATWVGSQERRIEHEILADMHRQLDALHRELAALRQEMGRRDAR